MKIVTTNRSAGYQADRRRAYRRANEDTAEFRASDAARKRKTRAERIPQFVAVDSEGIGRGKAHRAVLLGIGQRQYVARDMRRGLQWDEVFEYLYAQFLEQPDAAFVGFYLGYDFNQWLRSLPQKAAWELLTKEGKASRKVKLRKNPRLKYWPVRCEGWEIDMLGFKRLSIRPREPGAKWMHICDAGPFFQMSFLSVINPEKWTHDPGGNVCTDAEFADVLRGKNKRATAHLDEEMKHYNRLENAILERVMVRLAAGFHSIDIRPKKDQWYGPGATASAWLSMMHAPKKRDIKAGLMPEWFSEACRKSYYGGWFEIFSHGLILGTSYNYDINNAYPFATTKLPHLCEECRFEQGTGDYDGTNDHTHVLVYGTVFANNSRIGPVPYRAKDSSILRPAASRGWYWLGEIDAAKRAGLVRKYTVDEWVAFTPCNHAHPFLDIERLYNLRLEVGKNSARGMAIKLNNNSAYGKFAQNVGGAPYNNWFYASFITAHCRIQILDAISTHPGGPDSVLMVATDGICFDSPHPNLPISKRLGEWEASEYNELVLFKPGVYWHKEGIERLLQVKSRGVPKEAFANMCQAVQHHFEVMLKDKSFPSKTIHEYLPEGMDVLDIRTETGWPFFYVPVNFRMTSCKEALNRGKWGLAGEVQETIMLKQDSDPSSKRRLPRFNIDKWRIDTRIWELPFKDIQTTYHLEADYEMTIDLGYGLDGSPLDGIIEAAGLLRDRPANYDLPITDDVEWTTVWDGGPVNG